MTKCKQDHAGWDAGEAAYAEELAQKDMVRIAEELSVPPSAVAPGWVLSSWALSQAADLIGGAPAQDLVAACCDDWWSLTGREDDDPMPLLHPQMHALLRKWVESPKSFTSQGE